jgi:hypothetical protein
MEAFMYLKNILFGVVLGSLAITGFSLQPVQAEQPRVGEKEETVTAQRWDRHHRQFRHHRHSPRYFNYGFYNRGYPSYYYRQPYYYYGSPNYYYYRQPYYYYDRGPGIYLRFGF